MNRVRILAILSIGTLAGGAPSSRAAIRFDVGGLAGTGVTGQVTFSYTGMTSTPGALTVTLENTTSVGGRVSGFAFHVPTIRGASLISIGGGMDNGGVRGIGSPNSSAIPENSSIKESGWFQKWPSDGIKRPNAAGDFDSGVMNTHSSSKFLTDGVGSGPRINNLVDGNDSTTFTFHLVGAGLPSLSDADFEAAFMNELSSDTGFYSFGVRYQGIGTAGLSDLAVPATTINAVPVPGAVLLAGLGLGLVGLMNRKKVPAYESRP